MKKILEMLSSADLEMVNLGVSLLTQEDITYDQRLTLIKAFISIDMVQVSVNGEVSVIRRSQKKWFTNIHNTVIRDPSRLLKLVPKNPYTEYDRCLSQDKLDYPQALNNQQALNNNAK